MNEDVLARAHSLAIAYLDGLNERHVGGTTWRGRNALRVSFSNWATSEDDVRRAARAIVKAAA